MGTMGGDLFASGAESGAEGGTEGGAVVEFVYRPTVADFEEALRARALKTAAGRVQVLVMLLAVVVPAVIFVLVVDLAPLLSGLVPVLSAVVMIVALVRGMRTQARQMFSIVEPYGECRMVADERGAVSTGERVSFTTEWSVYSGYLETPRLFVLFGGERASGVAVLPKRGAQDPADVERLRGVLGRNLKRS
ncbi:YcxB family protein [Kitasatospora albolonga]